MPRERSTTPHSVGPLNDLADLDRPSMIAPVKAMVDRPFRFRSVKVYRTPSVGPIERQEVVARSHELAGEIADSADERLLHLGKHPVVVDNSTTERAELVGLAVDVAELVSAVAQPLMRGVIDDVDHLRFEVGIGAQRLERAVEFSQPLGMELDDVIASLVPHPQPDRVVPGESPPGKSHGPVTVEPTLGYSRRPATGVTHLWASRPEMQTPSTNPSEALMGNDTFGKVLETLINDSEAAFLFSKGDFSALPDDDLTEAERALAKAAASDAPEVAGFRHNRIKIGDLVDDYIKFDGWKVNGARTDPALTRALDHYRNGQDS